MGEMEVREFVKSFVLGFALFPVFVFFVFLGMGVQLAFLMPQMIVLTLPVLTAIVWFAFAMIVAAFRPTSSHRCMRRFASVSIPVLVICFLAVLVGGSSGFSPRF